MVSWTDHSRSLARVGKGRFSEAAASRPHFARSFTGHTCVHELVRHLAVYKGFSARHLIPSLSSFHHLRQQYHPSFISIQPLRISMSSRDLVTATPYSKVAVSSDPGSGIVAEHLSSTCRPEDDPEFADIC